MPPPTEYERGIHAAIEAKVTIAISQLREELGDRIAELESKNAELRRDLDRAESRISQLDRKFDYDTAKDHELRNLENRVSSIERESRYR